MLGDTQVYNEGELIGSDEGMKLLLSGGKVIGTILGYVYGIKLGIFGYDVSGIFRGII